MWVVGEAPWGLHHRPWCHASARIQPVAPADAPSDRAALEVPHATDKRRRASTCGRIPLCLRRSFDGVEGNLPENHRAEGEAPCQSPPKAGRIGANVLDLPTNCLLSQLLAALSVRRARDRPGGARNFREKES